MQTKLNVDRLRPWRWLLLVPIATLYVWSAPSTVQDLDSGELVASAVRLTVAHPPGYPLYTWWHHLTLPMIPWGSAYHRASLCSAVYMLSAMAFLIRLGKSLLSAALVAGLATAPLIWLYAVTPDVFALHLMTSAALIALAFAAPSTKRTFLSATVFGLGAANHQTTIFLAPLLALVVYEEKNNRVRFLALVSGAAITVIAYASIAMMDTGHLYSWKDIRTPSDIILHFLRRDYGTFQLSAKGGASSVLSTLRWFIQTCNIHGGIAIVCTAVMAATTWRRFREHRAWWTLAACLVLYVCVFFPRIVIHDAGIGPAIAQRFFLLPMLLLGALAAASADRLDVRPLLRTCITGLVVLTAVTQSALADVPDLRHDTVIEDWARNLLAMAKDDSGKSVLVVSSDTQLYATRYVQAVDSAFDSVYVVAQGLMFEDTSMRKLSTLLPDLYDAVTGQEPRVHDLFADFVLPNRDRYPVTYALPVSSPSARTVIYPLGRRAVYGTGTEAAKNAPSLLMHAPRYLSDSSDWVETKALYSHYAAYHLARSQELVASGDREGAKNLLSQTLTWMPYCIPCKRNVCALETDVEAKRECGQELSQLEAVETNYWE